MKLAAIAVCLVLAACSSPAAPNVTQGPPETFAPIVTEDPMLGTGVITFGTAYDPDTLRITTPKSSFKTSSKKIAWSASFSETAGTTTVIWILAKVSGSGVETILFKEDTDISSPDFDTLANDADLALLVDRKAGTYVMRYLRDADLLAEGEFKLTK